MLQLFESRSKRSIAVKNRSFLLFLLCLLLSVPFVAAASETTVNLVPTERMISENIVGLDCVNLSKAGEFSLLINSDTTRWEDVLAQSPSMTEIDIEYGINPPSEEELGWVPTHAKFINGNIWKTDADLIAALSSNCNSNAGLPTSGSADIAYYTPEKQNLSPVFTSTEWDDPKIHAVCWSNGSDVYYEKMIIRIAHTRDQGVTVQLGQISAEAIDGNTENIPGVTEDISDSQVHYTFDPAAMSGVDSIMTAITAPEGADSCRIKYQYSDPQTRNVESGKVFLSIPLKNNGNFIKGTSSERMAITWLDGTTEIPGGAMTIMATNKADNHSWLYYTMLERKKNQDPVQWLPVPDNRLNNDSCVINAHGRIEAVYDADEGLITVSLKDENKGTPDMARKLMDATMAYRVNPPHDIEAAYVRVHRQTSTPFFADQTNRASQLESNIKFMQEPIPVKGGKPVEGLDNSVFIRMPTAKDNVWLYSTTLETEKDGGAAYLFFWYDESDTLLRVEWIAEQASRMVLQHVSEGKEHEDEICEKVTGPVFVDPHQRGWKLYAEYQVQESANAYRVNLTLKDTNGNPVEDFNGENIVFYLPYLEGFDYTNCEFDLKHYQDELSNQFEILSVEATPYGLRFEAQSLSPFVVSWDVIPSAPALPATGDSTPVNAAWLAMLLSVLGLLIAGFKARRA